jgi:chemotaxis protein methyltransferase WspC
VQGNVHADDFLPGAEQYDMIFCRNLLIYFDAATQRRTIAVLERLMRPSGVLFVGPAETSLFLSHGFVSANIPLAFALQRSAESPATAPRHAPSAAAPIRTAAKAAPVRVSREAPRKSVNGGAPSAAPTPVAEAAAIDRAFELADQGRLAEAKALCETELRDRGPSAQAYYLLGVIHSADGSLAAADRCYRKALYLDSHHHDALLHLAALLDQQGKAAEAKILRQRARRS